MVLQSYRSGALARKGLGVGDVVRLVSGGNSSSGGGRGVVYASLSAYDTLWPSTKEEKTSSEAEEDEEYGTTSSNR